jgi:hypothetical protein
LGEQIVNISVRGGYSKFQYLILKTFFGDYIVGKTAENHRHKWIGWTKSNENTEENESASSKYRSRKSVFISI